MRSPWIACLTAALAALSHACGKADPGASPASGSAVFKPASSDMPPPRTTRRTTSGDIAIGNLDGQIESLQKLLAAAEAEASNTAGPTATLAPTAKPTATLAPSASTPDLAAALAGRRRQLIDLLSVRAEFAGRIADSPGMSPRRTPT